MATFGPYIRYKEIPLESNSSGLQTLHTLTNKSMVLVEFRDLNDGSGENSQVNIFVGDNTFFYERQMLAEYLAGGTNEVEQAAKCFPTVLAAGTAIKRTGIRHKLTLHIYEME